MTEYEKGRLAGLKEIFDKLPKYNLEAGLSGNRDIVLNQLMENYKAITDIQLKYKNELYSLTGLDAIVNGKYDDE